MLRHLSTSAATRQGLLDELRNTCASVGTRAITRLTAAHDASHYLLIPQAVVAPADIAEVSGVLAATRRHGVSVTFRSGGTSLSGQASSAGVLVDIRRHFRDIEVLEGGDRVRCGPGATVRAVNVRLARHGRKLGPDPASEIACTIGGVVANNSSGMACGIEQNTYQTLDSCVLVLPSGTVIDTALPNSDDLLRAAEPNLHRGLENLRDRVRGDRGLIERIRRLYAIKNTMGYGVNSFLDHDSAVDILEHLLIGSEGTLAFVAEATFRTVPIKPRAATGLLIFHDLAAAAASLPVLVAAGLATIELMDAASLRVAQRDPEATDELRGLSVANHAALLVEYQEETVEALETRITQTPELFASLPLAKPPTLSTDTRQRDMLWHIRKGLFTAVAGNRPPGTTALLEDIAVPVDRLYQTCTELIDLFDRHGYEESVIFGHAKDGNIHFMLNECFDQPAHLRRYEAFTEEMVDLVLSQGGSLKAEHGTGRVMAPFVRRQFGDELYGVMRDVKNLVDPEGLLNPGVLLTDDPGAHLHHLKTFPTVDKEVDRCVECGYCEPACPSKDITMTPRERIVLRRELERAREAGDTGLVRELQKQYDYDGVQTCAVDGMCETACPVHINTGDLVRRLRGEAAHPIVQAGWKVASRQWAATSRIASVALALAKTVPSALPAATTIAGRGLLGDDTVPRYTGDLPAGGARRATVVDPEAAAVYFSSCTTTIFGPAGDGDGVAKSFQRLCARVGIAIATPDDLASLCCGTPWKSKGLRDGYAIMKAAVSSSLLRATRNGELPVVSDASSCTEGLRSLLEAAGEQRIRVLDCVDFVDEMVLPRLLIGERIESLTLHPTCSSTRMGTNPALIRVAQAVAHHVVIPDDWGCCAFAGDRGMLHPELTASATAAEAGEVAAISSAAHASLNRTCELGMTRATGRQYRHVLEVLDEVVHHAIR